ncbi:hypothetical protein, partial [Hymenobacter sp.]|uniref:hypothetical protein n=1 Tax=Hymenobacter sp. TaxID=1898978 RepID=UPI00286B6F33
CPLACCCRMATIWASLNRPFFMSQLSGSEKYAFLYSQLAHYLGKRTGNIVKVVDTIEELKPFIAKQAGATLP